MGEGGGWVGVSEFDFRKGEVGPLYPVLVDAYGNVIDGLHRLEADPKWPKKKLEWVKTEREQSRPAKLTIYEMARYFKKDPDGFSHTVRDNCRHLLRNLGPETIIQIFNEGLPTDEVGK